MFDRLLSYTLGLPHWRVEMYTTRDRTVYSIRMTYDEARRWARRWDCPAPIYCPTEIHDDDDDPQPRNRRELR